MMSELKPMMYNAQERMERPPMTWEAIARELWALLDDIDTAGDMFKPPINSHFKYVNMKAEQRFRVASSDGYELDFNTRPNDAKMDEVDNIETYIKDVHNLIVTYYGDDALTEADVREVLTAFRHLVCKQSEGSEQS